MKQEHTVRGLQYNLTIYTYTSLICSVKIINFTIFCSQPPIPACVTKDVTT